MLPAEHQNPLGLSDIYLTPTNSLLLQKREKFLLYDFMILLYCFHSINYSSFLQGWSVSNISPFEALMLLCSYEERTKETTNPGKLESRELKLSELLTKEDFDMACSVNSFFSYHLACRFLTSTTTWIQIYFDFHHIIQL